MSEPRGIQCASCGVDIGRPAPMVCTAPFLHRAEPPAKADQVAPANDGGSGARSHRTGGGGNDG